MDEENQHEALDMFMAMTQDNAKDKLKGMREEDQAQALDMLRGLT